MNRQKAHEELNNLVKLEESRKNRQKEEEAKKEKATWEAEQSASSKMEKKQRKKEKGKKLSLPCTSTAGLSRRLHILVKPLWHRKARLTAI
ncbi:hypothetical protein P8452_63023 [Trifolium repens]|nr:hypothetical protein P8452_63023 [Trifolium repens]